MLVYVAGPYSKGDVVENVHRALEAGNAVLKRGHEPFIPHLTHFWHIFSPKSYEEWIRIDTQVLVRCNAVLRIPGESVGADNEVDLAKRLGIPIYSDVRDIPCQQ